MEFTKKEKIEKIERLFIISIAYSNYCNDQIKNNNDNNIIDTINLVSNLLNEKYENIYFNIDVIKLVINQMEQNKEKITNELQLVIKNNITENFLILPLIILQLIYTEIIIIKSEIQQCIADYLTLCKIFGISEGERKCINAIIQKSYNNQKQ